MGVAKAYRILFVCLGNICRSPAAEGVMKKVLEKFPRPLSIEIDSAGTSAHHQGEAPDSRMCEAARRRQIDLTSRSRPVEKSDLEKFDLVIAMDRSNLSFLTKLASNEEQTRKIKLMSDYLNTPKTNNVVDIPDPYFGSNEGFDIVLDLLEEGTESLLLSVEKTISG